MMFGTFFKSNPIGIRALFAIECAERFSYYVVCSVLMFFFTDKGIGHDIAAEYVHIFIIVYFFIMPVMGYISDFVDNRKMIILGMLFFIIGHFLIFFSIEFNKDILLYLSLFFIIIAGGITKPANSVLLGDQYVIPKEQDMYSYATKMLYYFSNIAIAISLFFTPLIYKKFGSAFAFFYPLLLILLAFFLLIKSYDSVKNRIPVVKKGNFGQIIKSKSIALLNILKRRKNEENNFNLKNTLSKKRIFLVILTCISISSFYGIAHQCMTSWYLQALSLNTKFLSLEILPMQVAFLNPIGILSLTPLSIYLTKKFKINVLNRLFLGFLLGVVSLAFICMIQVLITYGFQVNIMWQIFPYALIALGESFVYPGYVEFAYSAMGEGKKNLSVSISYFSNALGNATNVFFISMTSACLLNFFVSMTIFSFVCLILFFFIKRSWQSEL